MAKPCLIVALLCFFCELSFGSPVNSTDSTISFEDLGLSQELLDMVTLGLREDQQLDPGTGSNDAESGSIQCYVEQGDSTKACNTNYCLKYALKSKIIKDSNVTLYGCGLPYLTYKKKCVDIDLLSFTGQVCACEGDSCNGVAAFGASATITFVVAMLAKTWSF